MAKKDFIERRNGIRAQRILSIQFRNVKRRGEKLVYGPWQLSTTHDMSHSGISFLCEQPHKIDDILELQVIMSGVVDILKGFGRVVRIEREKEKEFFLVAIELIKQKNAEKILFRK